MIEKAVKMEMVTVEVMESLVRGEGQGQNTGVVEMLHSDDVIKLAV